MQVSWADVGGHEALKAQLQEFAAALLADGAAGARPRGARGLLLFGPPGCSKTLLARALACEARANFISVKGSELYSKYVGESEKAVARVFSRARQAAPAIVFFDEIDGLTTARGAGGAGVRERVLSQLLSELDGLQQRTAVVVVAATNRPDLLDAALLRPGRFDRLLHVPPPDEAGRAAVLAVLTRRLCCGADVAAASLAHQTEGFTGADLKGLCSKAAMAALDESLDIDCVSVRHFEAALAVFRPSPPVSAQLQDAYAKLQRGGSTAIATCDPPD